MHMTQIPIVNKTSIIYQTSSSFERFLSWTNEKEFVATMILKNLHPPHHALLDIGSGDGSVTQWLTSSFDHVTLIEPSQSLHTILTQTLTDPKFLIHNQTLEMTQLTGPYDVILAAHSFRYVKDPESQLHRLSNVLSSTGRLILIEISPESRFWPFYLPYEQAIRHNLTDPMSYDYQPLLSKLFHVEKQPFTTYVNVPSVEEGISILDFLYDVPHNQIPEVIKDQIRRDWLVQFGQGPIQIQFDHILYLCQKTFF